MCILTEEEVKAIREAVVNEFRTNPNLTLGYYQIL
jgi:hypothetical protein